jgi:hypothetical protein
MRKPEAAMRLTAVILSSLMGAGSPPKQTTDKTEPMTKMGCLRNSTMETAT